METTVSNIKSETLREKVISSIAMFKKEDGNFSKFREPCKKDIARVSQFNCEVYSINKEGIVNVVFVENSDSQDFTLVEYDGQDYEKYYGDDAIALRDEAIEMIK